MDAASPPGWTPDIATGIEWQDQDHQELLGALARLETAIANNDQGAVIDEILAFIDEYGKTHFGHEEHCIEASAFPGIEEHLAQHDAFMEMVVDYEQRRKLDRSQSKLILSDDLAMDLCDWLVEHIQDLDHDLAGHLKATGCTD
ncbi:MAG: bacteriohemerythrin [Planctomycetota bacterium]